MIGKMLDHYRIESKPCNRAMVYYSRGRPDRNFQHKIERTC